MKKFDSINNYDQIFEELSFSKQAEKSLNEFSNWIFTISLGVCALVIIEFEEIRITECYLIKYAYLILVIYSMLNILLTGYNKYQILKRDTILNIKYGELKKMVIFHRIRNQKPEDIIEEWEKVFLEWTGEFNKIKDIGRILNISLVTTLIAVGFSGLLIIILVVSY